MCGITGIFAFNPVGRINLVHLEGATRCLESRGPDFQDSWFDDRVGLGHRRLSIIDTSDAGNQPMTDATGRYHIIYNGEIYNYRELQAALRASGVGFRSDSDTEVLLYAYIHWGTDLLEKLNGFFAFAIYDQQEQSLFVARDRYGIKPLYFFQDEDKFLFASGMQSILTYGIERKLNKAALHAYFQLTYIPAPMSMIAGVHKLEPGHYLRVERTGVEKHRYYTFPYREKPSIASFENAKTALVETLRKSVHDRLIADVPLGAFLSGGVDSSVIVALASEQVQGLKTFSIGFKDNQYFDETAYAELVSEKYKTDHHTITLNHTDLLSEVSHAVASIDEPFADSSALPVYMLSKHTKKQVKVALSGDGADEIFSGYNKHSAWLMSLSSAAPGRLVEKLAPLWSVLPKSRNNRLTDTFRKLERFAKTQRLDLKERYWFLASFVADDQIDRLLKAGLEAGSLSGFKNQMLKTLTTGDLNEILAIDSQLVLQGDMLTKVDMMSMANGLEVRVPFLDPRVVSLAFDMPAHFKVRGNNRKLILREAFRDFLPAAIFTRPKHGFEIPLLAWFKSEMKAKLEEKVFNREKIEEQGIFDWNEIARIKRKLYSFNPGDISVLVWSLYVFQCWYERFFKV